MFDRPELNNPHYDDCYFSYSEGLDEALYVFVDGNGLPERIGEEPFLIGETGFGTGLNLLALIKALDSAGKKGWKISFYSVEKYPLTAERVAELFAPFSDALTPHLTPYMEMYAQFVENQCNGWNEASFKIAGGCVSLHLYVGDVKEFMETLSFPMDAWFLDGHSPDKNPDMWNEEVFQGVGEHCKEGGTVATFSAAGVVKRGLREVGFFIKRRKGFGGKRHMSIGEKREGLS